MNKERIAQLGAEIDDLEHAVANACHRLKAQAQQAGEVVTDARIIREVLKAGGTQYGEEDRYIDIESSELVAAVRAILATTPPAPAQPADYWQGEYERVFAEREACKQHNDMLHDAIETVTRENHKATQGIGNLHIIAGKRHGDIVTTTAAQPVQGVPDVATWLWLRFADYCRKQGMNPHHQNDLFAIVHDLRAMLASPTPPAQQKGGEA